MKFFYENNLYIFSLKINLKLINNIYNLININKNIIIKILKIILFNI